MGKKAFKKASSESINDAAKALADSWLGHRRVNLTRHLRSPEDLILLEYAHHTLHIINDFGGPTEGGPTDDTYFIFEKLAAKKLESCELNQDSLICGFDTWELPEPETLLYQMISDGSVFGGETMRLHPTDNQASPPAHAAEVLSRDGAETPLSDGVELTKILSGSSSTYSVKTDADYRSSEESPLLLRLSSAESRSSDNESPTSSKSGGSWGRLKRARTRVMRRIDESSDD